MIGFTHITKKTEEKCYRFLKHHISFPVYKQKTFIKGNRNSNLSVFFKKIKIKKNFHGWCCENDDDDDDDKNEGS